jgi:hypothetical protein
MPLGFLMPIRVQVGAAVGHPTAPWTIQLLDEAPDAPHLDALLAALDSRGGKVTGPGSSEPADLLWAFEPQAIPGVERLVPGRVLNHVPGLARLTSKLLLAQLASSTTQSLDFVPRTVLPPDQHQAPLALLQQAFGAAGARPIELLRTLLKPLFEFKRILLNQ